MSLLFAHFGVLHESLAGHWSFYPADDIRIEASTLREIADKLDELNGGQPTVCKPCQDDNRANCECDETKT